MPLIQELLISIFDICFIVVFLGNIKIGENPTFYRTPTEYFRILQSETSPSGISNLRSVFVLKRATSVKAYIKVSGYLIQKAQKNTKTNKIKKIIE